MEDENQNRVMTPKSRSSDFIHFKSTNDDPEFGKEHEWKRLSLMLIQFIFFIITLGFNGISQIFWAPNNGIIFHVITENVKRLFPSRSIPTKN